MTSRSRGMFPVVAACLVVASGCAQDVAAPLKSAAVNQPSFSQSPDGPHGNPNAVKYADTGEKPATGRSGSASIESRALLAKDGSTQVEATTGSLEAGTHPGNIDKTQVKILIGDTPPDNYNHLSAGGYWTATYPSLARGDSVQLHNNVSGIDPRVDVVLTTTRVKRRPDIVVRSVIGPAKSVTHASVTFTATVSEINGDVGARSDCLLSVNNASAESAEGIWVDAGGTVTCKFTHVFADPGTYAIQVTAANVNPGDWDVANNNASTSITIVPPGVPIASGRMYAYNFERQTTYTAWNTGGITFNSTAVSNASFSQASLGGVDKGMAAGGMQRVDGTVLINGSITHKVSLQPTSNFNYDGSDYSVRCGIYDDSRYTQSGTTFTYSSSGNYATICAVRYRTNPQFDYAIYTYSLVAGAVTYSSHAVDCYSGCNTYLENYSHTYGSGLNPNWALGSSVEMQLSFVDLAGVSHTADRTATLDRDDSARYNYSTGTQCYADTYRGGRFCSLETSAGHLFSGYVAWP